VRVRLDLTERETPRVQAELAQKYRRELRLWSALPGIRASHRLVLFDTGSPAVWSHLRRVNALDGAFDAVVNAAEAGLPARAGEAYPALVSHLRLVPAECLVADVSPQRLEAAAAAGCRVLRYRTPKSLKEALVTG
jgi:FMN phosphatase YigB (HAD superfamily)